MARELGPAVAHEYSHIALRRRKSEDELQGEPASAFRLFFKANPMRTWVPGSLTPPALFPELRRSLP
jgi:hypothetical protein